MELQLRDYQAQSIEGLKAGFVARHKNQILCAPCGAGKSECAVSLIDRAQKKGKRVMFIVDRIVLVNQISKRLDQYGIEHGVLQAGHWRMRPGLPVQVASAQTLEKRGIPEDLDAVYVDECHAQRKLITKYLQETKAAVIGLTATPFAKGMGKVYSNLVNVTTTNALIKLEYLVPLKMYAAKKIDMTGKKTRMGEWTPEDVEERGMEIVGDIVAEWQEKTTEHFGGPAKTIVFSATVKHGEELCRRFQDAGFNFQQISYKNGGDEDRKAIIDEFAKPDSEIMGLVSCEIFTKGFDNPSVMVGVSARPYKKSLSSHIQQIGRVMRSAPGKSYGLWLDHSGNCVRFGEDTADIFENGVRGIDNGKLEEKVRKEASEKELKQLVCPCGCIIPPGSNKCPACGKERKRQSLVEEQAGVMVELNHVTGKPLAKCLQDRASTWRQLCGYATDKYGNDPERARKWCLAKYRSWYNAWPSADFAMSDYPVGIDLKRMIIHDNIKYAKGMQKAKKAQA